MTSTQDPEIIVARAAELFRAGRHDALTSFDGHAMAIYATDPDGLLTYYNRSCVDFAGWAPVLGEDRWCVSWKLFTRDGEGLAHDQCPMAVAIQERRTVRGAKAVAQRPDGARVEFMPFPTPVLDEAGALLGGVNALVRLDTTLSVAALRTLARRYRRLAMSVDSDTAAQLEGLGAELDAKADRNSEKEPPV